jgi:hypothetical protein
MIIIALTAQEETQPTQERLSVEKDDMNACPQAAGESDFLDVMDGWL